MKNKKRNVVRTLHIHITDEESLERTTREAGAFLDELGTYVAQRSQKECSVCQQTEWMNQDQTICWGCERRTRQLRS